MHISEKILTLSVDYKNPKGGVAQVVKVYSSFYAVFNHIATTGRERYLGKIIDLVFSYIKTFLFLLFKDVRIVHIHGSSYNSFWRKRLFINLVKLFNKKIVYHVHGAEYHLFYRKYPNKVKK